MGIATIARRPTPPLRTACFVPRPVTRPAKPGGDEDDNRADDEVGEEPVARDHPAGDDRAFELAELERRPGDDGRGDREVVHLPHAAVDDGRGVDGRGRRVVCERAADAAFEGRGTRDCVEVPVDDARLRHEDGPCRRGHVAGYRPGDDDRAADRVEVAVDGLALVDDDGPAGGRSLLCGRDARERPHHEEAHEERDPRR